MSTLSVTRADLPLPPNCAQTTPPPPPPPLDGSTSTNSFLTVTRGRNAPRAPAICAPTVLGFLFRYRNVFLN